MALTIPDLLRRAAEQRPEHAFVECGARTYSYYEFRQLAMYVGAGLLEEGIEPGDRVALYLPNGIEFLECWLALASIGAITVPINTGLKAAETAYILEHSEARALIAGPGLPREVGTAAAPWSGMTYRAGESPDHPWLSTAPPLSDLEGVHAVDFWPDVEEDDVAAFIYTSGSTGKPKAVMQTQRTYALSGEGFAHWTGVGPEDRLLTVLPLFHINAQAYSTMGAIAAGATLVLEDRFSASRFWETAARTRATHFNCVGAMMQILLKAGPSQAERGHCVRTAYCAPALAPAAHRAAEERFGLNIVVGYGLSECTYGTVTPLDEPPRPPSMGVPRQHPRQATTNSLRLVSADGQDVGPGEPGEIWLSNDAVMKGYYRDPEATAAALVDGWLRTGDIAVADADGWLTFVDRKSDQIRRRGENIASREIEERLSAHPAVLEAAVVGVDSELSEQEVKAFVVLRAGHEVTAPELSSWCAETLAAFKLPRFLELRSDLPRTPTHRIAKHLLRREPICPDGCFDREAA